MPAEDRVARVTASGRHRETDSFWLLSDGGTAELQGSATMTRVVVCQKLRAPSSTQQLFARDNAKPWVVQYRTADNAFRVIAEDSVGNQIVTLASAPEDRVGEILIVGLAYDGANVIGHLTGGTTGSAAANGGIGAAGSRLGVGCREGGLDAAEDFAIIAAMGTDAQALTAAQLDTLIETELPDNLEHGRLLSAGLSTFAPEVIFDARDIDFVAGEWPDQLGASAALGQNGEPELLGLQARI